MADIVHSGVAKTGDSGLSLPGRDVRRTTFTYIGWGIFAILLMWAWEGAEIRPLALIQDAGNAFSMTDIELGCPLSVLAQEMAPIDEGFRRHFLRQYRQRATPFR